MKSSPSGPRWPLAEHELKIFRRGESSPANSAVRYDKHPFVDSARSFRLNMRKDECAVFRAACERQDADRRPREIAPHPGREANAGLRSAVGEWHRARLRLRPDRAR